MGSKGQQLRNKFIYIASTLNSVGNEIPAEMYFHALVGAYFKDVQIRKGAKITDDLRVSIVWVQDSRSGKGALNKVMEDVCEKLGLIISTETDFSTAGLIGYVDSEVKKYNIKYNLSENKPEVVVGGKRYSYQDPIIKGDLGNHDIVIFDEAKLLLKPSTHTENLLSVLSPVYDCPPHVRKKLAAGEIKYSPYVTTIATTINIGELSEVLLTQGFFQRQALYINDINGEDRQARRPQRQQNTSDEAVAEYDKLLGEFVSEIKKIVKNKKFLEISEPAKEELDVMITQYYKKIKDSLVGKELKIAESLGETIEQLTIKIAGHYAVLDEIEAIERKHIIQASYLIIRLVDIILNKIDISENNQVIMERRQILQVLSNLQTMHGEERVTKMELYNALKSIIKGGYGKIGNKIDVLVRENYIIIEKGDRRTEFVSVK